ncbi:hypothetical protein [Mucilaginibacter arboris]|uniref:VCBS repeat-containing protein n=1 Tax=Mucilaginibacter arboris TaxID=2682090 RepID=A0A7K1SV73_9SPHI|nr:hypothetical protein [Mucilaginibacter arboris]MVN21183.1 hypothetical protein [Mucilaginibacter arboris]
MLIPKIQLFILANIAWASLGLNYQPKPNPQPKLKGSFTIKRKQQLVWLILPKIDSAKMDCIGGCAVVLKFADPKIPTIKVKGAIGGTLYNLGDLNNDGKDEVGVLHEWFNGCWNAFDVYTFKHGFWEMAVQPISTHCNQWEANLKPIVKDPAKKGFVKITYSAFENNDIVFKTKSVAVK